MAEAMKAWQPTPTLDVVQTVKYDPSRVAAFRVRFSKRARYDMAGECRAS